MQLHPPSNVPACLVCFYHRCVNTDRGVGHSHQHISATARLIQLLSIRDSFSVKQHLCYMCCCLYHDQSQNACYVDCFMFFCLIPMYCASHTIGSFWRIFMNISHSLLE